MNNKPTTADLPANLQTKDTDESKAYYGTLTNNDKLLTVVKVVDGGFLEKRMIQISLWKSFLEKGDFKNAVVHIEHSTMSYYKPEQLKPGCDERLFNELYAKAILQF